jgi:predicted small lipoprotein YifL
MTAMPRPLIAVLFALGCTSCGLKGPLYLPDTATNIEVRPAPTAGSSATSATEEPPEVTDAGHDQERRKSGTKSATPVPQD